MTPREEGERGSAELVGVSRRFGAIVAVEDLDLAVRPGEFLCLLGPSGCGKTTTLRMLAGFEQPDAGEIRISGRPVHGVPPHKRDVNTVFQAYALFPHMTVAENVAYGLRQRRVSKGDVRRRVAEALEMVQMSPLAQRKPKQLSGGQQQRVALARALVNRPSVLLLDEPLGALDRKLREEMQLELKLLQTQLQTTFVFVTHDQEEALSMSDRIAVMLDGRLEQLDSPAAIYEEPASAFVAGFIGRQNFFSGVARDGGATVDSGPWTLRSSRAGTRLADGAHVVAAVRPESIEVSDRDPGRACNTVQGTLASTAYLGSAIQYLVVADGGKELVAVLPRRSAPQLLAGARVHCTWAEAHTHVFPAKDTDPALPVPVAPAVEAVRA